MNRWRFQEWVLLTFFLIVVVGVVMIFVGCSTVVPKPVQATQEGFIGNKPASQVRHFLPDGGEWIPASDRAAYDDLIAKGYGKAFLPPLTKDAGVIPSTDGGFEIDKQHLSAFIQMWKKFSSGVKAP